MTTLKLLSISLLLLALSACSKIISTSNHQQTFYAFGTSVIVQFQGISQQKANLATQMIEKDFHHLHREWHAWDKGGIVSQINQAIANKKSIVVTDEVKNFILQSQQLSKQSDYIFDPAIGKLIQLWSFHSEDWQPPPPGDLLIKEWLRDRPSIKNIQFNGNQLTSSNNQVQLDFGANAKGLALSRAAQYLEELDIQHAIINIGGDMSVIGHNTKKDGLTQPWQIGIQNPSAPQKMIAIATISTGLSIVTSGTYQRYFEWQGKQYSHLIDPNTGKPANTFSSVTVIHSNPTTADAAATAILIAGKDKWQKIAKQMGVSEILLIDQQGKITNTTQRIKIINQKRSLHKWMHK